MHRWSRVAVAALGAAAATLTALGGPAAAVPVRPVHVPATRQACDGPPVVGEARCLARFRSLAGARTAGSPAGAAALAARAGGARLAGAGVTPAAAVAPPEVGYGPADIKRMYGLDTTRGAGRTIAVVDAFDNPNAERDLAAFRKVYKLPACTTANGCFRKVNQRGGRAMPPGDPGWGVEIALDLQAVSAACPRCRILYVGADSPLDTDLYAAVDRAVALGAKVVTNSWGGLEYNGVLALGRKHLRHPGVAILASSGDSGFTDALFPASWSSVIAVGGTTVTRTATGYRHTAWAGAGSGCSAWVPKPSWQKDRNCLMRTTSDLSALADPETGFAVYDTYGLADFGLEPGWLVVGGTSLASPLVAGMIGLRGNAASLGNASYVYAHRGGLRDVTSGSNGFCGGDYLCTARPGYDGPTGLGTPKGLSAL